MSCECAANTLGLLGLYEDSPAGSCASGLTSILIKLFFVAVDVVSTSLDWQVAFRLAQGDYQLFDFHDTEELSSVVVGSMTAAYVCVLLLSHIIFIRGKWFYLMNKDWAAFAMTEVILYALEDVATIYLFLLTKGFFDTNSFLDRFNVIISNVSGYLVVLVMWARLLSCVGGNERAPCSAYALPIWVTIESVLISIVSYRTLFQQTWEVSVFDFIIPLVAGGWAVVTLFWIGIFLCRWPKCLKWAENPTLGDHSLLGFIGIWTLVFGITIVCGWGLTRTEGEMERDWIQSFSEMRGEIQPGGSGTLHFGHVVKWGREGDQNGYGSSLLIGALDPLDHSTGYSAWAELCDPPCIDDWTIDRTLLRVPFCTYPSAFAGFLNNESGTYGYLRRTVYARDEYRYGPARHALRGVLRFNDAYNTVSIASGGSDYYDATPGEDPTPNAMRIVAGFPYPNPNYTGGLLQVFQLYKQRYRTGGFVNTAHAMYQIGQNIVQNNMNAMGDQISMGALNSSRFVATATQEGRKVVVFFEYNDVKGRWKQAGVPLDSSFVSTNEASDLDTFCKSIQLSGDGNRLIIGFPGASPNGAVYVFEWTGSAWEQKGNIIEAYADENGVETSGMNDKVQSFGYAVTINEKGTRIAAAGEAEDSSFVFAFELQEKEDTWVPLGSVIKGEGGNCDARYRHSLSMNKDGNFVAIGGVGTGASERLGRVRVFKYSKKFDT